VLDKLFRPYRARIHVTMELPSIGMIKRFVAADAGVSFISESFAKDYVKAGEVKLLTVEGWTSGASSASSTAATVASLALRRPSSA